MRRRNFDISRLRYFDRFCGANRYFDISRIRYFDRFYGAKLFNVFDRQKPLTVNFVCLENDDESLRID